MKNLFIVMKSSLDWCFKKKEIEIIEPRERLMQAYLVKSDNALNAMRAVKGNFEWEISAAYYLMYCSTYALLMKLGVRSKSHKCMIEFCRRFLLDHLSAADLDLLEKVRECRNTVQYHIVRKEEIEGYPSILGEAKRFCKKCRDVCGRDLSNIRKRLCNIYG